MLIATAKPVKVARLQALHRSAQRGGLSATGLDDCPAWAASG